jgi:fermentation-respiration switch protein FrsA (DUF1100 family)
MTGRAQFLRRAGYSVLLIDFQGTGESTGEHITFGWKESRDVLAGINFIHQVEPTAAVAIIGSSLGGAAALLATPPLKIDALVLEEVYPTIEIATRNRLENYLGAFGRTLTPFLLKQLQWRLGVSALQIRPVDHIEKVECPVFIISGDSDKNTRPVDTRMLIERARSLEEVWIVANAGHVDLHRAAEHEYETRVLDFLRRSMSARQQCYSAQSPSGSGTFLKECEAENSSTRLEIAPIGAGVLSSNVARAFGGPFDSFPDKSAGRCPPRHSRNDSI